MSLALKSLLDEVLKEIDEAKFIETFGMIPSKFIEASE